MHYFAAAHTFSLMTFVISGTGIWPRNGTAGHSFMYVENNTLLLENFYF